MARLRTASALAAALLLAACGGGGSVPGASPGSAADRSTGNKNPKLLASPASLTFAALGALAAQSLTITAQNPGSLTAASSNTDVARVDPPSTSTTNGQVKSASFTVTPAANGTATITVTNKNADRVAVAVTVAAPPGPLTVSASSVTICPSTGSGACNSSTQIISVTQPNFTGSFTERDDCDTHVATVTTQSATAPNATFSITGQSQTGSCRAIFQGAGASTGVAIIVAQPGITIDLRSKH